MHHAAATHRPGAGHTELLLLTGRTLDAAQGLRWGFFNRLVEPDSLHSETAAGAEHAPEPGENFGLVGVRGGNCRAGRAHLSTRCERIRFSSHLLHS